MGLLEPLRRSAALSGAERALILARSITDLDLSGKRVFIRVDFNVPIKNGTIGDDTRIRASLPTINYALEHGATVVLASHLGRPKGKPNPEYSLKPVASRLSELLGRPVEFAEDCIGASARAAIERASKGGKVVLLENLRFHAEEEKNDSGFAKELASLADVYVNDAFGSAHRAHASTEGIVHHVTQAAAGLLMIFIGRDLGQGDASQLYFQDAESYLDGTRFGTATRNGDAEFHVVDETRRSCSNSNEHWTVFFTCPRLAPRPEKYQLGTLKRR